MSLNRLLNQKKYNVGAIKIEREEFGGCKDLGVDEEGGWGKWE